MIPTVFCFLDGVNCIAFRPVGQIIVAKKFTRTGETYRLALSTVLLHSSRRHYLSLSLW